MKKETGSRGWSFQVGDEFKLIDNGDSIQAAAGARVVYLSVMQIDAPSGQPTATQLRRVAARWL